jgi:hypothetical protein
MSFLRSLSSTRSERWQSRFLPREVPATFNLPPETYDVILSRLSELPVLSFPPCRKSLSCSRIRLEGPYVRALT